MVSQHLLSDEELLCITSQPEKLPDNFNRSEYLKRINKKIEKCFNTFNLVLNSKNLPSAFLDTAFRSETIGKLLVKLTEYEWEYSAMSPQNSLNIASVMLTNGFSYYSQRFKKAQYFWNQIQEMQGLISSLNTIAYEETKEKEIARFYQYRKRLGLPPKIAFNLEWTSVCMICWVYASGKTKEESRKNIRHIPDCPYDKSDPERWSKDYPPIKLKS